MTRQRLATSLVALTLALWAGPLTAQTEIPPDWLKVEVIVFAQQDTGSGEGFPGNPTLVYPERLQLLQGADELAPTLPAAASYNETLAALMVPERFLTREAARGPAAYVPLDQSQRQLGADAHTLGKRGGYRVLYHGAWLQPAAADDRARPVYIAGGGAFDQHRELEGSLKVTRSRFIHVAANLWLTRFEAAAAAPPAPAEPASAEGAVPPVAQVAPEKKVISLPEPPAVPVSRELQRLMMMDELDQITGMATNAQETAAAPRFAAKAVDLLQASQQIELNNLTYLDHPRMGVLVLVSSRAEEKPATEDIPLE